jgi:DNA-binding IclR family transcriptional regulator
VLAEFCGPTCLALAIRWTITSVSVEAVKIEPCASSSSRSTSAFTRLPLWATATAPPAYCTAMGWAFFRWLPPAVE